MNTVPFIVAELSANHNQVLDLALKTVEAAAKSGAHAIKLQTYKSSCLTLPYRNESFRIKNGIWKDKYLCDLYNDAQMPWHWHKEIFSFAKSLGMVAFSSPFSIEGVEFLEMLDCPIYKIASFEVMHVPLLRAIAQTKKPVILSLGVASDIEIEYALEILSENASKTILYCISDYPTKIQDVDLSNIFCLQKKWEKYDVRVGLSDHTLGITVPIVATMCGISMIEKHFILDRKLGGVDSQFSLNTDEFKQIVESVYETCILSEKLKQNPYIFQSIGVDFKQNNYVHTDFKADCSFESNQNSIQDLRSSLNINDKAKSYYPHKDPTLQGKKGREFARSLFVLHDVKKGDILTMDNIACVRPSNGLSPLRIDSILGKSFSQDVKGGTALNDSYIAL
ncbi:pseudaminic acid synthase [Helicobacter muridarum]|uniref:Pseudaminic acid synthase n=1 Tax=Helicobacter muridarum TaxID=216 RepID=A0A099TXX9_9HELI|nr:pseudaminic acid synthase [Helicobacter muridarum]TLD99612.1 pseudaminic acid synthase [Helicobacter muridarum]STQ86776.1 sialic acid synthase [Helicobacter muridarum]